MKSKVCHEKLGDLYYEKGPGSIHWWHGTITGCEQGFDIILDSSDLDVANVDFIADMIRNWNFYLDKALAYIRGKLAAEPELFGLSKEDGENASRLKAVPFDCPQFVFYEKQEWSILFLENGLGVCEPFGISADFNGTALIGLCDLSDAEEIGGED